MAPTSTAARLLGLADTGTLAPGVAVRRNRRHRQPPADIDAVNDTRIVMIGCTLTPAAAQPEAV
jgi:hypothetical protein